MMVRKNTAFWPMEVANKDLVVFVWYFYGDEACNQVPLGASGPVQKGATEVVGLGFDALVGRDGGRGPGFGGRGYYRRLRGGACSCLGVRVPGGTAGGGNFGCGGKDRECLAGDLPARAGTPAGV
jgi:hypothetical protein